MITLHSALTIAIAAKLPILLWGAPGSGKTSMITALAHDLDLPLEVVVGSIHEPSDFTGLPVVRETTTWFAPPHWAERLAKRGRGILFLDELTTAPPAVQAAMLRIVLEKTVGHLRLPPHVQIIAAANPPSVAADGWDLAAPLANRFIHLQWQPTATDIATGFISGFPRFTSLAKCGANRRGENTYRHVSAGSAPARLCHPRLPGSGGPGMALAPHVGDGSHCGGHQLGQWCRRGYHRYPAHRGGGGSRRVRSLVLVEES